MIELSVPYKFSPRPYQLNFFKAMDSGLKRACKIWHRRTGKDKTDLNYMIKEMCKRVGYYVYFFPTTSLGRKILWNGIGKDGFKFIDHFPKKLVANKNESEMRIILANGSIFQIVGTNKIENVGTNPVGVVYSEWSLQAKPAWDYIRPILRENDGWAVFNFTPRGKNHAYDMAEMARLNDKWFFEVLTAKDTGVVTEEMIQEDREEGMTEDMIQQEYFCSFEKGIEGSYYGKLIQEAELAEPPRVTKVPYDRSVPVNTAWDLGIGDSMIVWYFQLVGTEVHCIDYSEETGKGIDYMWTEILKKKDYDYGDHYAPHDVKARSLQTAETTLDFARNIGLNFRRLPRGRIEDGITQVRVKLPNCWFDKHNCAAGLKALSQYHKQWDETHECYRDSPVHDWSSHGADAFRYLCQSLSKGKRPSVNNQSKTIDEIRELEALYRRPTG